MRERDYTSYYRPLALVQRAEVATRDRVTPSRDDHARRESMSARESDRSSLRVVQGARPSSHAAREAAAAGSRRVSGASSASRTRRDDFDDYYASYEDEYAADFTEDAADFADASRPRASLRRPARRGHSLTLLEILAFPVLSIRDLALGHVHFCAVILAIALMYAMLFAPVRDLYIARRQLSDLQVTYDALAAENEAIREEIEVLNSEEGVETEARERGYVAQGETKVVVEGLPELEGQDEDPTSMLAPAEVVDDRPWYIRFFDNIFGYKVGE